MTENRANSRPAVVGGPGGHGRAEAVVFATAVVAALGWFTVDSWVHRHDKTAAAQHHAAVELADHGLALLPRAGALKTTETQAANTFSLSRQELEKLDGTYKNRRYDAIPSLDELLSDSNVHTVLVGPDMRTVDGGVSVLLPAGKSFAWLNSSDYQLAIPTTVHLVPLTTLDQGQDAALSVLVEDTQPGAEVGAFVDDSSTVQLVIETTVPTTDRFSVIYEITPQSGE